MTAVLDDRELQVGEAFETTLSMRLLIPYDEIVLGDSGEDIWKPRSFDEWIRSRFQADAVERALNAKFEDEGHTTRVEVELCEVLSTRPAASERPDLKGNGKVAVQRADLRVRLRVVHNVAPAVAFVVGLLLISLVVVAASDGASIDEILEKGARAVGRAAGAGIAGLAGPLVPLALLALLFLRRT